MDYFSSIHELLHLYYDINQITNNHNQLLFRFLNIRNIINQSDDIKQLKLSKFYKFGNDQNVMHIKQENDEYFTVKLAFYQDVNVMIDGYYANIDKIDIYKYILHQTLCGNVKTANFNKLYKNLYSEINQNARKCQQSQR